MLIGVFGHISFKRLRAELLFVSEDSGSLKELWIWDRSDAKRLCFFKVIGRSEWWASIINGLREVDWADLTEAALEWVRLMMARGSGRGSGSMSSD